METNKIFLNPVALRNTRKGSDGERIAEFIISDETKDRHGTVIPLKSWDLENFNNNGVVGYQHELYGSWLDSSNPDAVIGKAKAFVEDDKLIGEVTFEPESMGNELANKIWNKLEFGTLKATSVGFLPLEKGRYVQEEAAEEGEEPVSTYHYGKVDLLEFSIVNIPSNPSAVKRAFDRAEKFNKGEVENNEGATELKSWFVVCKNKHRFDLLKQNEVAMGGVKCPECDEVVTQADEVKKENVDNSENISKEITDRKRKLLFLHS